MNSAVDTGELLGGFEQVDATRHRRRAADRVDALFRSVIWVMKSRFKADTKTPQVIWRDA